MYDLDATAIADGLRRLFGLPTIHLRDAAAVALALDWSEAGLGLVDAFHLALAAHCDELVTFDRRFAARAAAAGPVPPVTRR